MNVNLAISKAKKEKILKSQAERKHKLEFSMIEKAAKKAFAQDCARGLVAGPQADSFDPGKLPSPSHLPFFPLFFTHLRKRVP